MHTAHPPSSAFQMLALFMSDVCKELTTTTTSFFSLSCPFSLLPFPSSPITCINAGPCPGSAYLSLDVYAEDYSSLRFLLLCMFLCLSGFSSCQTMSCDATSLKEATYAYEMIVQGMVANVTMLRVKNHVGGVISSFLYFFSQYLSGLSSVVA